MGIRTDQLTYYYDRILLEFDFVLEFTNLDLPYSEKQIVLITI